jgi:hypothetical protein
MSATEGATDVLICPGCARPTTNLHTSHTGATHRVAAYDASGMVVSYDLPVQISRCDATDCPGHFHLGRVPER